MWSSKTENCIVGVHTESADLLRMAAEESSTINMTTMQADQSTPDDETTDEINVQVSTEAFGMVKGTGKRAGLEVWRRRNRHYDGRAIPRIAS